MVRVNLGINPKDLTDEHLIAEYNELLMLLGWIEKHPTGTVPKEFSLGKGHISFFRDKIKVVAWRLLEVEEEMIPRNFSILQGILISIKYSFPDNDINNFVINCYGNLLAERIVSRLRHPLKKKTPFHYYHKPITDMEAFIKEHYDKYLKWVGY